MDSIILLHVERLQGRSLLIDMLGEAELETLKESMKGTEHKKALDKKAVRILDLYKKELATNGFSNINTVIRDGQTADEIIKVAQEHSADQILLGYKDLKGLNRLFTGSVVKDVQKRANIPVVVATRPLTCEEPYSWKDAYTAVTVTTVIIIAMFFIGTFLQKGMLH